MDQQEMNVLGSERAERAVLGSIIIGGQRCILRVERTIG